MTFTYKVTGFLFVHSHNYHMSCYSRFSVCQHQVVLREGICNACDVLFNVFCTHSNHFEKIDKYIKVFDMHFVHKIVQYT